jgi:two-component sensor histidine kinase
MDTGGDSGEAGPDELQHEQLASGLLLALKNTAVSVFYQDRDLRVIWAQNIPHTWSGGSIVGQSDRDFLPGGDAEKVVACKRALVVSGAPEHLELCLPAVVGAHDEQWFELWIDADRRPDGTIAGIVTTAVETTEQKRRERTLRVLLREVSHRSRNLLAIIQSIATQTGRYSVTVDGFLTRFRGRLQSLASSQDLVTSSNWRGADLRELALGQIARYSSTPHASLHLTGAKPWLTPNAALHVGLALHELISNSVSYGALALPGGYATLNATVTETEGGGKGHLSVEWRERLEDAGTLEEREKRFGSVALERIVPASLNGSAELRIEDGMLTYRLLIPADSYDAS